MVDSEALMRKLEHLLPHRFPFRMVDRVVELEPGRRAVAVKAVGLDDFFLEGHFPHNPRVPEVLIVEALAQTGGIALLSAKDDGMGVLVKIEEMHFHKTISPGARLTLFADVEFSFGEMAKVRVRAASGEETVAQGVVVLAGGKQ